MPPRRPSRAGLVLTGALGGLFVVALVLYLFLRISQVGQVEEKVEARLDLPPGTVRLDAITDEGRLRISLRDVVLLDDAGDTVAASPSVSLWFDPAEMGGEGPLVFSDVVLEQPDLRLRQSTAGEWNIFQALRIEANGGEVDDGGGRPLLFTDVRVSDGTIAIAIPSEASDPATFAGGLNLPRRTIGGVPHQVYLLSDVQGRLPRVLLGGADGWEAEVGALTADLLEPELEIRGVSARFASTGADAVRFDLRSLRVGSSAFAGSGTIDFGGESIQYDVEIEASPLEFADLAALVPGLPREGRAAFTLATEPLGGGRTALLFSGLDVDALEANVGGRLGMVIGGGAPLVFRDTELAVASLDLSVLESLGLVDSLPVTGVVEGTLSTTGAQTTLSEGALFVDLTGAITPADQPNAEPSAISAVGGIAFGEPGTGMRMEGLRLRMDPLRLATLRPFAPDQAERLQGVVTGSVTLDGSMSELRLSSGEVTYLVGDASPTRLSALSGTLALEPELRYDLRAEARPLALATLTELFPGLPFRTAELEGPIALSGGADRLDVSADLAGPAGAFAMEGSVMLGETPVFDLSGRVRTLSAAALLSADLPIEGAVTGTFSARGTPADLRFAVDFEQIAGRFALEGRLVEGAAGQPRRFEVVGDVVDFRLGSLIGQPALFPAPMTGSISLTGGGPVPYRYDIDLRGDRVILDLAGTYSGGAVPSYTAEGTVRGLDLSRLPFTPRLPRTDLNARLDIDATGTTPETLRGSFLVRAEGSRISGVPLDVGLIDVVAREGLLFVDTVAIELGDTRFAAGGTLGLTAPSSDPLTFALTSPNLTTVARAAAGTGLPPDAAGSLRAEGWVTGSLEYPRLVLSANGRGLQYNAWGASQLSVQADVNRSRALGWAGEANVEGEAITLASGERFQRLQIRASGDQSRLGVGLYARRDAETDVTAAGTVELDGATPRGLNLESLTLRLDGAPWSLAGQTRLRWGGVDGLLVENLLLRRGDGVEGSLLVNGMLPPTGTADLEVRIRSLGLSTLATLVPGAPPMQGVVNLDAVLEGPVADPRLTIDGRIDSLSYQGATADSASLAASYASGTMQTDLSVWRDGKRLLDGEARIPMILSLTDLLPSVELRRDQPLFASLVADSLDLGLFTAAVPQLADGRGALNASALVGGTIERPDLEGRADLRGGSIHIVPLGVTYSDLVAGVRLEGQEVVIDSVTAFSDGAGRLAGRIRLGEGGSPYVDLVTDLESFEVMDVPDGPRVQVTGGLALRGDLPGPVLSGEMTITESTFQIPELAQGSTVELEGLEVGTGADTVTPAGFLPPFLAGIQIAGLEVNVGESVWLESNDARIQIAGEDLVVYRTAEELRVFGVLRAERGTYALRIGPLTREFEIVSGSVQFFGTGDLNPELEITASNRVRTMSAGGTENVEILVNITGTVQFPRIALTTNTRTPYPESEILSLLLFGRPTFGLGGAAERLASEVLVQEAIGGIIFAPLEQIFLQTGLVDYIQFRSVSGDVGARQTLGGTTVEIGTEISDNVFLTLECGVGIIFSDTGGAGCGTRLQLDLGSDLTASAAYEPIIRGDRLLDLIRYEGVQYQWSTELRKRWEFGRSEAEPGLPRPDPNEVPPPEEEIDR